MTGPEQQAEGPARLLGWPAVIAVSLLLVALLAGAAIYLRSTVGGVDIVGVCAAADRQVRIDDQPCEALQPGTTWVYYRVGNTAPAIGQSTAAGIPANGTPAGEHREARGGIPVGGGPVVFTARP